MIGELTVLEPDDVGHINLNAFAGGWNTHEITLVRAMKRLAGGDGILFRDLIKDLHAQIGKGVPHDLEEGPHAVFACRQTR